ncbi:MAG: hypothetical protein H6842_07690 [Rhodospirillaceae bacterium]|nr:hypothetical protein [Rhodospirillaceae bacterium]
MTLEGNRDLAGCMRQHAAELCSECDTFSVDGRCLHGPVCVADRLLEIADVCEADTEMLESLPAVQLTRF